MRTRRGGGDREQAVVDCLHPHVLLRELRVKLRELRVKLRELRVISFLAEYAEWNRRIMYA